MVQSVLGAPGLLQGNHDDAGVVGAQHALAPPQQSVADQLPGTRHSARCLKREKGYCQISLQIMLSAFASIQPLKGPDRFEFKLNMFTAKKKVLGFTHDRLIVVLTHGDRLLRWHHVPQAIAAQDDVAVFCGVQSDHAGVWLWRNHKLTAIEVVTPQITCCKNEKTQWMSNRCVKKKQQDQVVTF